MIARVRVLVHRGERVRGHGAPGAAEAAGAVVVVRLQRRRVAVVLRGAAVVLVDRGRGRRSKVWMGVRVRVIDAAHVVRVLLELDERGLGRRHRSYAAAASASAARVLATDGRVVAAARAVGAAAATGARSARAQSRRVHGVAAGHRRRGARGPLLLLLVSATTAAPSERAPDLPVIQRDGCRVQRSGGEINFDRRPTCCCVYRCDRERVRGAVCGLLQRIRYFQRKRPRNDIYRRALALYKTRSE